MRISGHVAVVATAAALLWSSTAIAEEQPTGATLTNGWDAGGQVRDSLTLYLSGILDGLSFGKHVCIKGNTTKGQAAETVVYVVKSDPELLGHTMRLAAAIAAVRAFPCEN